MDFMSFEMRVQLAIGAALKEDPVAVLHEVTMHNDYASLYCIFSGKDGETITVKVAGDNKTTVIKNSWTWDALPIEWPASMSYNTARTLFDEAFPKTPWSTVVLRKSTVPPNVGSEYVFAVADGYVVVDVSSKTVYKR